MFSISPVLRAHARGGAQPSGIVLPRPDGSAVPIGALVRWARGSRSLSTLAFPALATTGDPELVRAFCTWLFAQGITEIKIGSFTSGVEGYSLPAAEVTLHERMEYAWPLTSSAEQRFRALRSNHKRKLQKLRKEPLVLRKLRRYQPEQLTKLRLQWGRRRALSFSLLEVLRLYQYHRFLHRHLTLQGVGHLYGLYDGDGALLSLAYMLEVDDTAFYMIGASSPAGYQQSASLRLFWDLAEHYQSKGFRTLHFGGVPAAAASEAHAEHGVLRFKAGFGVEPISRTSLSIKK
jgi:hypothetical protein